MFPTKVFTSFFVLSLIKTLSNSVHKRSVISPVSLNLMQLYYSFVSFTILVVMYVSEVNTVAHLNLFCSHSYNA